MDKSQYNRNYYERHKEEIKAYQKLRKPKATPATIEAHRKAARDYYRRKKEQKTLEELQAKRSKKVNRTEK